MSEQVMLPPKYRVWVLEDNTVLVMRGVNLPSSATEKWRVTTYPCDNAAILTTIEANLGKLELQKLPDGSSADKDWLVERYGSGAEAKFKIVHDWSKASEKPAVACPKQDSTKPPSKFYPSLQYIGAKGVLTAIFNMKPTDACPSCDDKDGGDSYQA